MICSNELGRSRENQLARLLFIASFAEGIDTAALMCAIGDGLVDRRDAGRLRSMVGCVDRLRRSYAAMDPETHRRLGSSRYLRRANFARGVLASADAS